MTSIATAHTAVSVGDTLVVRAAGETITFALSGTYVATIQFERAVGSGELSWEVIAGPFSLANATVSVEYTTRSTGERFRSRCTAFTSSQADTTVADGVKVTEEHTDEDGVAVYTQDQERRAFAIGVSIPDLITTGGHIQRNDFGTPAMIKAKVPSTSTTSTSMSEDELLGGIHIKSPVAAQNFQLPTGAEISTAIEAVLPEGVDIEAGDSFEFTLINTGTASDIVTITVDTNITVVGYMGVHPAADGATLGTSVGRFLCRNVSANVWILYRIG